MNKFLCFIIKRDECFIRLYFCYFFFNYLFNFISYLFFFFCIYYYIVNSVKKEVMKMIGGIEMIEFDKKILRKDIESVKWDVIVEIY